jgi:hypothetical protein
LDTYTVETAVPVTSVARLAVIRTKATCCIMFMSDAACGASTQAGSDRLQRNLTIPAMFVTSIYQRVSVCFSNSQIPSGDVQKCVRRSVTLPSHCRFDVAGLSSAIRTES